MTPAAADHSPLIEIFRAGTHVDASGRTMTFTREHLDEVVTSYNASVHEAPVVVGHPKTDDPRLGGIAELVRQGDSLFAREQNVVPEFDEARDRGLYTKRSASFYLPDNPSNPTPGKLHLRHVGWLGGMPPAIKGLADKLKRGAKAFAPAFAEDDGEGVVEFNDMAVDFGDADAPRWAIRQIAGVFSAIRDKFTEQYGADAAERIVPRWQLDSLLEAGLVPLPDKALASYGEGDEPDITHPNDRSSEQELHSMTQDKQALEQAQEDLRKEQERFTAERQQFDEQRRQAAEAERERARTAAANFAEQLVNAGRLLPAQREGVVELLVLADAAQPLSFGEGDEKTNLGAGDLLRELLAGGKQQIDFSEKAGDKERNERVADFAAPAGSAIDADSLAQHNKALAYQREHPNTPYLDAVRAVAL